MWVRDLMMILVGVAIGMASVTAYIGREWSRAKRELRRLREEA